MTEISNGADVVASSDSANSSLDSTDAWDGGDLDARSDYGAIDTLDARDEDGDSLVDHGADYALEDPELSYDELPDFATDVSPTPQPREASDPAQVHGDASSSAGSPTQDSPAVEAARADVARALDQGDAQAEAREAVDAAYAEAVDTARESIPDPEPSDARIVNDSTEALSAPTEVHTPEEQLVVDDAKASLDAREQSGEVLGGDPVHRIDQWHQQGQNDRGYQQDCALASTSAVLRDCGVDASESDVVDQAAVNGLCETGHVDPADNGGVRDGQAISEILTANGVESRLENPQNAEELAEHVEQGRGVITEIDADELWGSPTDLAPAYYDADGRSNVNHAVQVTGTVRDGSGELTGIVINDTGSPYGAGTVVPTDTWDACWSNTNRDHETIVTVRPAHVERAAR